MQTQLIETISKPQQLQEELPSPQFFRCYLRTSDMKCKISEINGQQSFQQFRENVKQVLGLTCELEDIELVVNQAELSSQCSRVGQYLHQNVIVHVLVSSKANIEQNQSKQFSITVKQPPISSASDQLGGVSFSMTIKDLKEKILEFYKTEHSQNQVAELALEQLYLVFGGRILSNDKCVQDYRINSGDVVYVVNSKQYARQVTKEEAQRRVQQIRSQPRLTEARKIAALQTGNATNDAGEQLVFTIVQNIVHDIDSDEQPQDDIHYSQERSELSKSLRVIKKYNSQTEEQTEGQNQTQETKIKGIDDYIANLAQVPEQNIENQSTGNIKSYLTGVAEKLGNTLFGENKEDKEDGDRNQDQSSPKNESNSDGQDSLNNYL